MRLIERFKKLFGPRVVHRCLRCDRPLKNKLALERGYGADCWKKIHQAVVVEEEEMLFAGPAPDEVLEAAAASLVEKIDDEIMAFIEPDPLPGPVLKMDPESGEIFQEGPCLPEDQRVPLEEKKGGSECEDQSISGS